MFDMHTLVLIEVVTTAESLPTALEVAHMRCDDNMISTETCAAERYKYARFLSVWRLATCLFKCSPRPKHRPQPGTGHVYMR